MKISSKIKVLVADDHPVVVNGVRSSLAGFANIEIVGEVSDGSEVMAKVKKLSPDVILLDISLPTIKGPQVLRQLQRVAPEIRVIAFTVHNEKEYVDEMIQLGARGYLLKDTPPDELARAIETVFAGDMFFSSCVQRILVDHIASEKNGRGARSSGDLSEREEEIVALIAQSFSNDRIASALCISPRTVETHRQRIMNKLNIHTPAGLTRYAIDRGLIQPAKSR